MKRAQSYLALGKLASMIITVLVIVGILSFFFIDGALNKSAKAAVNELYVTPVAGKAPSVGTKSGSIEVISQLKTAFHEPKQRPCIAPNTFRLPKGDKGYEVFLDEERAGAGITVLVRTTSSPKEVLQSGNVPGSLCAVHGEAVVNNFVNCHFLGDCSVSKVADVQAISILPGPEIMFKWESGLDYSSSYDLMKVEDFPVLYYPKEKGAVCFVPMENGWFDSNTCAGSGEVLHETCKDSIRMLLKKQQGEEVEQENVPSIPLCDLQVG